MQVFMTDSFLGEAWSTGGLAVLNDLDQVAGNAITTIQRR
jgi:hypothetical protein